MIEKLEVSNRLEQIDEEYQLIIIGGGIYGAALCWEAAHRGIKVLLVEQEDYACGASSNSLKTIHGGLRSLQSLNIKAVIKGIRERSVFLRISPNYVKQLSCILPTTTALMKSRPVVGMGLLVYNLLNRVNNWFTADDGYIPSSRMLSRKKFISRVPGANIEGITGGALWFDAQVTNTERLVWQFIKSAMNKGAVAVNHTAAIKHINNSGHGLLVRDQIKGAEKTVRTSAIVDCSASWDFIRHCVPFADKDNDLNYLKSVNVVIKKKLFNDAVGVSGKTGPAGNPRLYFFSPWRECTMIGTWYTNVKQYNKQSFSHNEAKNIVEEANSALGRNLFDIEDICNVHIGYLPARINQNKESDNLDQSLISSFELKDWSEQTGLYGVYSLHGTKYTLARYDAKQVIDNLAKTMKWNVTASLSHRLPIYQTSVKPEHNYQISDEVLNNLITNYGTDIEIIFGYIKENPQSSELIPGSKYHIMAEIYFAVIYEQAITLSDLLKRRLDIGDRAPPDQITAKYCAEIMQKILSWSDETMQAEISKLYKSYPDYLMHD